MTCIVINPAETIDVHPLYPHLRVERSRSVPLGQGYLISEAAIQEGMRQVLAMGYERMAA